MDLTPAELGLALLFAVEPTDRALAGWAPAPRDPGHPVAWARWMLCAVAGFPAQLGLGDAR